MNNYDLTEIIKTLDDIVDFRENFLKKFNAVKTYDTLKVLGDQLEDALLNFDCQIIDNMTIENELDELKEI